MTTITEDLPPLTFDPGTGQIHVAMVEAMRAIGAVAKGDRNKQQGFDFRGIDAVINAVGPVLREHGIFLLPLAGEPIIDHYVTKGGSGTPMTHCLLPVTIRFVAEDGSFVECQTLGEAADAGDKVASKAHSVALRIALLQTFAIPTDEPDPDSETHERGTAVADEAVADLVTSLGWANEAELEEAWVELRDDTKGDTDALKWVQSWVRKQGIKKGTFTAAQAEAWYGHLNLIDNEGQWIDGEPPADPEGDGA